MSGLIGWRIVKFLGVAVFASGIVGAGYARDCRDRSSFAYGWGSAGWLVTWIAGYGMLKASGLEMREPFVLVAMGASMLALLFAVARAQDVLAPWTGALGVGALATALAGMGLRNVASGAGVAVGIGLAAGMVFAGVLLLRGPVEKGTGLAGGAMRWFEWVARAEGLSLLALFGVYMPAKYALHVELDGGQGWFGWVHGMLFMMYLVALASVARAAGWGLIKVGLGAVASLLPFGTFAFEAWLRKSHQQN